MSKDIDSIILAGGYARRLAPITDYIPKPLLLIDGVPLIEYVIRSILELDVNRIIISTNKKFEKAFRYFLRNVYCNYLNGRGLKFYLSVEPSESNEEKLGAVGGLWFTIQLFNIDISDNDLLVILGDNLYDFDLKEFISFAKRKKEITIGAYKLGNNALAKNYGVLYLDNDNRVKKLIEKPENPESDIISTGIYYFPNEKIKTIGEFLEKYKKVDAIGKLFEYLVNEYTVYSYIFKGKWFDIGTKESYEDANRWASNMNLGKRWLWP